jgi:hypothetical protein
MIGREANGNRFVIAASYVFNTSSDLFSMNTNGDVGLSTAPDPSYKLKVNGNILANEGNIRIEKTTDPTIEFNNGSANRASMFYDTSEETFVLNHTDADANQLVLTSGNNVGIGTNDPNATLHVYSAVSGDNVFNVEGTNGSLFGVTDNLSGVLMSVNTIAGLPVLEVNSDYSVTAGRFNQNDFAISSSGNVGIGTASPSGKLDIRYPANDGMFLVKDTDSTDGVFIGDIGSSVYQGIKHISHTGANDFWIRASTDGDTIFSSKASTNLYLRSGGNNSNSEILLTSTEVIVNNNSSNLDFRVESNNNANMLFVDGVSDKVGIGTGSPSSKLTIGTTIGTGSNINSTSGYNFGIHHSKLRITSEEDTSTNPNYPLINLLVSRPANWLGGTASIDFETRDRGNNVNRGVMARILGGNAPGTNALSPDGGYLSLDVAASGSSTPSSRMVINRDGNVGIGTTSPDAKLEISSIAAASGDARYELLVTEDNTASAGRGGGLAFTRQGIIYGGIKNLQNSASDDNTSMYFQTRGAGVVSNRMTINEAGNVGIGTTSPSEKLHVMGGTRLQGDATGPTWTNASPTLALKRSNDAPYISFHANSGSRNGYLQFANASDSYLNVEVNQGLRFRTNSQDRMYIAAGGNVGIGTTSPSTKLHIYSAAQNPGMILESDSTSGAWIKTKSNQTGAEEFKFGTNSVGWHVYNDTDAAYRLSIANDGNVGIGTTSPAAKLDVNGSVRIDSVSAVPAGCKLLVGDVLQASSAAPIQLGGLVRLKGGVIIHDNTSVSTSFYLEYAAANGLSIYRNAGTGSQNILLAEQGGNVGIGTASPNEQLSIGYADASSAKIEFRSASYARQAMIEGIDGQSSGDGHLAFHTRKIGNALERLRITADGNVGIGTASPSAKLDVKGTWVSNQGLLSLDADNGTRWAGLTMQNNGTAYGYLYHDNTDSYVELRAATSNGIRFFTNNAYRMFITSLGDVGIGTASPAEKLHVSDLTDFIVNVDDTATRIGTQGNYDLAFVTNRSTATDSTRFIIKAANAGEALRIDANNNVGVGTDSPNAVLHAYGSTPSGTVFNVEGTNGSLFSVVDNLSGVLMSVNNNAGLPVFEVNDDDSIVGGRFAQNDFVVTTSGDIGMGTANPSSKLEVNGTVTATCASLGQLNVDNLRLDGNTLSSTDTDGDINLSPSGNGDVVITSNAVVQNTLSATAASIGDVYIASNNITSNSGGCCSSTLNLITDSLTVGTGHTNNGCCSSILGGRSNCITASASYVTMGGGFGNTVSGYYSTVSGGINNDTGGGTASTVSGGWNNTANGNYSTVGGGCGNSATGSCSTVSGGRCNCANGCRSTVSGGFSNTASGSYSTVVGGYQAKASRFGEVAHAAGGFSWTAGTAQHSTFVARKNTTDATANVELFLDIASARMTLTAETTWTFDIKLSAYNDTDNTTAWWIIRGGIRRNAASGTALIGSLIEERDYEGTMSGTSAAVTADDTNESLKIAVTGLASKNIRWVAVVDVAQVSWGTP